MLRIMKHQTVMLRTVKHQTVKFQRLKLRKWNQLRLNLLKWKLQRLNQLNQPKQKPNPNPPKYFQQRTYLLKKPLQMRSTLFRIFYRKNRSWHCSTTLNVMKSKKKQAHMSTLLPPSRAAIHSILKMSKFSRRSVVSSTLLA